MHNPSKKSWNISKSILAPFSKGILYLVFIIVRPSLTFKNSLYNSSESSILYSVFSSKFCSLGIFLEKIYLTPLSVINFLNLIGAPPLFKYDCSIVKCSNFSRLSGNLLTLYFFSISISLIIFAS